MTDGGTIGSIAKSTEFDRFFWYIEKLKFLGENKFYWSPGIQHLGNVWKLRIYPNGTSSIPSWTMLEVCRTNGNAVKSFRFSLGIRKGELLEQEFIQSARFPSDAFSSGLIKFTPERFLRGKWTEYTFLGSNRIRIIFTVWIDEPAPLEGIKLDTVGSKKKELTDNRAREEDCAYYDPEGKLDIVESETKELTDNSAREEDCAYYDPEGDDSTLRQRLSDMLLTGDDHDITIKVKGKRFKAHKCMLRLRSSVFAAMFKHKMEESTDNSVSIDDCDPESFGEFLHYLYTGRVKNLSINNVAKLYYAGDKYNLSGLKKICVEFLKASLSTTIISDVISLAANHSEDELLDCVITFFSKHIAEIMSSVEWKSFAQDNPVQADEISLKAFLKLRSQKN